MPPCFQIERIDNKAKREDFGAVNAYAVRRSLLPTIMGESTRLIVMGRLEETPEYAIEALKRAFTELSVLTFEISNGETCYEGRFKVMHFNPISRMAILWSAGEVEVSHLEPVTEAVPAHL